MNLPGTTIHKLIDNLTRSPFSFALYRLPWTDEPILVLQEEEDVEVLNSPAALNGKRGFVMTPFHQTEEYPVITHSRMRTAKNNGKKTTSWKVLRKQLKKQ